MLAGGNGQLSARIIQELLRGGFKVTAGKSADYHSNSGAYADRQYGVGFKPSGCTYVWLCCYLCWHIEALVPCIAGVADVEEAQAGLDFAKRFEIIKGAEAKNIRLEAVDLSDESAIADALPRYLNLQMHSLCVFVYATEEVRLSCMPVRGI